DRGDGPDRRRRGTGGQVPPGLPARPAIAGGVWRRRRRRGRAGRGMSAQPARAHLGIGEVLSRLRAEFPDVSVSKIRFLESEGLIEPARSPSGYRRFDEADVERLRYILTAQRDQSLPLRVIKERLVPPSDGAGPAAADQDPDDRGALSRRQLLAAAGIDDKQLAELETYGLVRRTGRGS